MGVDAVVGADDGAGVGLGNGDRVGAGVGHTSVVVTDRTLSRQPDSNCTQYAPTLLEL